jgi:hypothetical protein
MSSALQANLNHYAATAGSKNYLRSLSLGKLRKYADAYNLRPDHIIEKDDLVDRLMSYRVGPTATIKIPHSLSITPGRDRTDVYLQRMRYVIALSINRSST